MTKKEYIQYWIDSALEDWQNVQRMYKGRSYVPCLFFLHLVFEKLAKATWVKENVSDFPPRIHNILVLLQQTSHLITENEFEFYSLLNRYQMEGRYPDYSLSLGKVTTRQLTKEILTTAEPFKDLLILNLSENATNI